MVHHAGNVVLFIPYMVKLKDTMIIQPTLIASQSLLVLQKLLSILVDALLGFSPTHA
jgi:enamine deaminase RidA (YjgF/YER057c/UK114 family)